MSLSSSKKEWSDSQHVLNYLNAADTIPHRSEGESVLLDNIPKNAKRILDLGTGDGRLIKLIKSHLSNVEEIVALDVSPIMIKAVHDNFSNDSMVKVVEHDLEFPLPDMGYFDAVISAFAIHHLKHKRKYTLYEEIYNILYPTGVFCNLEHVSSPSVNQHNRFLNAIRRSHKKEDNTNRLLSMEKQLQWLRELGFVDVDCYWKWLELALLIGYKI
jgi:tRNA (cmo5U34)-methyltransferase